MKSKILIFLGMMAINSIVFAQSLIPVAAPLKATKLVSNVIVGQATTSATTPISIQGPQARTFNSSGPVYKGDVINSASGQTIKVTFTDQSEIWIAPQTNFSIQEFKVTPAKREALFHVEVGSVRALVQRRSSEKVNVIIHTRSATMGVRGTEFFVQTDKNQKTSLYTLDGSVAIAKSVKALNDAKSTRLVEKGKYSSCTVAQLLPSASKKYNPKELKEKLQSISPEIASSVKEKHDARVKANKEANKQIRYHSCFKSG